MRSKDRIKIFDDRSDIVLLLIPIILFGFFMLFFDVAECGDSFQYEHQFPMREPIYSLLLQLLQFVFKDFYRTALGVFQNILAVICTYWSCRRISKIYGFKGIFKFVSLSLLLIPHLLTPLASKTHLIITNTIMTEGISISIYYVWFTILMGILWDIYNDEGKKRSALVAALILSLVLSMIRGQMILCMPILLLTACFKTIENKNCDIKSKLKQMLIYCIFILLTLALRSGLTVAYNSIESGYAVKTVSSGPMLLANIAYVCDEEDAIYINDPAKRDVFIDIIRQTDREGLSVKYAEGNVIDRARFHEAGHETINFDIIDPAMRGLIYTSYSVDESDYLGLMILEDRLCSELSKELLPHVIKKYLSNYFVIASMGFVRSIAIERSVLPFYALLMYFIAMIGAVLLLIRDIHNKNALTMLLVIVVICGTVFGTSLVIQCITRYMIYNFAFFYIALIGVVKNLIKS